MELQMPIKDFQRPVVLFGCHCLPGIIRKMNGVEANLGYKEITWN